VENCLSARTSYWKELQAFLSALNPVFCSIATQPPIRKEWQKSFSIFKALFC
jgi:hypothetical protein